MKKCLLVLGIISFFACVLLLLFAALNLHGYHHLMDGSAEHYRHLFHRAIVGFSGTALFAVAGTLCMILYAKK